MFSCELYEISKNIFFTENLWATGSDIWFIKTLYYKMWQMLLQNATAVLLQNATKVYCKMYQILFFIRKNHSFITKCVKFITKWDSYYKMRRYNVQVLCQLEASMVL